MKRNLKKIGLLFIFLMILAQILTLGVSAEEIELPEEEILWAENPYYDTAYAVLFWITFILLCFVAPIPFLIVGIVFARSEKRGYPKYWYILSLIAALWLLVSTLLLIVLLI
ncbi:MAG: hypothetical protein IJY39_05650 [Clostridia bacterium]|nr:hypothetical protein [Clostridia bacterium]